MVTKKKITPATIKRFVREFKKLYDIMPNDSGDPEPALYAMQELLGNDVAITNLFLKIEPHMFGIPAEVAEELGTDPDLGSEKYIKFLVDWADGKLSKEAEDLRAEIEADLATRKREKAEAEEKTDWAPLFMAAQLDRARREIQSSKESLRWRLGEVRRIIRELAQVGTCDYSRIHCTSGTAMTSQLRKFPGNPKLWKSKTKRKAFFNVIKAAEADVRRAHDRANARLVRALEIWDSDGE